MDWWKNLESNLHGNVSDCTVLNKHPVAQMSDYTDFTTFTFFLFKFIYLYITSPYNGIMMFPTDKHDINEKKQFN